MQFLLDYYSATQLKIRKNKKKKKTVYLVVRHISSVLFLFNFLFFLNNNFI